MALADEDKAAAILNSMVSSMSGSFESVSVFVDEMTVFKVAGSQTALGKSILAHIDNHLSRQLKYAVRSFENKFINIFPAEAS